MTPERLLEPVITLSKTEAKTRPVEKDPVACAPVSARLLELARRVAASDCTVLIAGESGTGKEVLARFIHLQSTRSAKPFIAVNCAAIPENMLEAMLFGYERGAFTGAHTAHAGKFEQAQGGTLLLDEVSEMPLGLQAKLLRVLQEREVERLGARSTMALDVRVLATTNRQLRTEVSSGRFREDLYYRLNVFPMVVAPLRERRDDVLPLAMRLLELRCRPGERIPALSADAAHALLTYSWPGNVRELDNVINRARILAENNRITVADLPAALVGTQPLPGGDIGGETTLRLQLRRYEIKLLQEAIVTAEGDRRVAAQRLGISLSSLYRKVGEAP